MFESKKAKDERIAGFLYDFTTLTVLLKKKVFTMNEWTGCCEKLALFLRSMNEQGQEINTGDFMEKLSAEVESWGDDFE